MPSIVEILSKKGLINPPPFVTSNTMYEVMMGSVAYGVSNNSSDIDVYGFCISYKDMIFPHLKGIIPGFGRQQQNFEQYQQHHIKREDNQKEYDISIYNIVKYFHLCMENNPNMIDSLFIPQRCVLHCTRIGTIVRNNRKLFLHKGCFHKFKGYAFSQLHKARTKNPEGKRKETVEKYGWDVKFLYHVVRLLNETEQILTEHDLDLERSREQLKAIRCGEVSLDEVIEYFNLKERTLEEVYNKSELRYKPDEESIKELLLNCLEDHYGSLSGAIERPNSVNKLVQEIEGVLHKWKV